jgi:short-subunit dehydrogenase
LLVARNARVAAVDLSGDRLQELKESLPRSQADALMTYLLDITDREAVQSLPGRVQDNQGDVDAIVNCAGIIQPFVRVKNLDYDAIECVMKTNFYGTLYVTKTFLPHLFGRPEAHIVNISSMGGFLPIPGQAIYGASKAAVKLLTEALYAELKDTSIRVTVVFPGATRTKIAEHSGARVPRLPSQKEIPVLEPDEAARLILDGIENDEIYVYTGKDSKFMNLLSRINSKRAIDAVMKNMGDLLEW